MTKKSGVASRRCLVAAAVFGSVFVNPVLAEASVDEPTDEGSLTIVSMVDRTKELVNGDSDTFWSISLPDDATCPGDSANDQWRLQSFLLPVGTSPVDQVYGPIGPEPWDNGTRYSLWKADTEPFVHEMLDRNSSPGQEGRIPEFPAFNFQVLATGYPIPMGTYQLGIACTYFNQTAKWWDVQVVLEEVPGNPDRFLWRLVDAPVYEEPSDTRGWIAIGAVVVLFGAGVGAILITQARRRPVPPSADASAQFSPEGTSS